MGPKVGGRCCRCSYTLMRIGLERKGAAGVWVESGEGSAEAVTGRRCLCTLLRVQLGWKGAERVRSGVGEVRKVAGEVVQVLEYYDEV